MIHACMLAHTSLGPWKLRIVNIIRGLSCNEAEWKRKIHLEEPQALV